MAGNPTDYLALNLLNEGQTVTYRALSRALKVHSNSAKQMLYEFYCSQTAEKPGSLHATYLLTGQRLAQDGADSAREGDVESRGENHMRSSPLPASSAPSTHENGQQALSTIKVVTLVKEEQLEEAKTSFNKLLSIHIYSLEPGTITDLEVLTECTRKIAVEFASEDPLEFWKQYGTIQNSNVKRRTARRPPPLPTAPATSVKASKPAPAKQEAVSVGGATVAKVTTKSTAAPETASSKTTPEPEQNAAASSRRTTTSKPPTVKREISSIFKSFAKAKAKPQKAATEQASQPSQPETPTEDDTMGGLSDEEAGDEDSAMLDEGAVDAPAGKTKKEREEELRQMMEADDEPMDDAPAEADTPTPTAELDDSQTKAEPEPAETVTVSNGRRRGRRRIMKKKTVKDEEGYLVTKEEAAWESFSEDEPVSKKPKVSAHVPAASKGKKAAGRPGQGNIMSFFKKA